MAFIEWNDSLSVKVKTIDDQHKKLIGLINNLYDAMKLGKGDNLLSQIFDDLAAYTEKHFGTEEKYFDQFGYPDSKAHKAEHQKFVDEVIKFQTGFRSGQITLTINIFKFLNDWLIKHIKGVDQKYSDFFIKHGLN